MIGRVRLPTAGSPARPRRRRREVAVALAVAVATFATSGCSTFTDNDIAAKVNGRELSIDQLNDIAADFPALTNDTNLAVDERNEFGGGDLRNVLTRWVESTSLLTELGDRGIEIPESARTDAAAQYQSTDSATWTSLAPATQEFLVDFTVGRTALLGDPSTVSDDQVRSLYESGVGSSGILCVRIMAFATEAEATAVKQDLDGGADFATLADQHLVDPSAAPNQGVFVDQQTSSPCVAASNYGVLAQAVANTPIGVSTGPVPLDAFFFLMLQRPFDEVASDVRSAIGPALVEPVVGDLVDHARVSIDSRYGMWDATTRTVVPTR